MKAVPVSQKKTSLQQELVKKLPRIPGSPSTSTCLGSDMTFGGFPSPRLDACYEPMIVKEARYIAVTMMKVSTLPVVFFSLCKMLSNFRKKKPIWKIVNLEVNVFC